MNVLPKTIPAIYAPTVVTVPSGRFAVFVGSKGSNWYPVSKEFTTDDAEKHWVKELRNQAPVTKAKDSKEKSWQVQNSKKNGCYTVSRRINSWSCTCPSFGFRRTCKHIQEVKTKLV